MRFPLRMQAVLLSIGAGLLLSFLTLPLVALVATSTLQGIVVGLAYPQVLSAMRLSLWTSIVSLAIIVLFGTPLAWQFARSKRPRVRSLELLFDLPLVMPPAVAGIALLLTFGRQGLGAGWLYPAGRSVAFTSIAVIMAQVFVSAPLYLRHAISAFRRIDEASLVVARSFGASPLRLLLHIGIPVALPGLKTGAALSWARALGEFGATLMFAGNLQGKTQTLPLVIYTALETDLRAAQAVSIVLVGLAALVLGITRVLGRHELSSRST